MTVPTPTPDRELQERLEEWVESGDARALRAFVTDLSDLDLVHAFAHLSSEARGQALVLLGPERAAELLETLPDQHAAEAVGSVSAPDAARILEELQSDERVDLISQLLPRDAEAILSEIAPDTAAEVRAMLCFDADTAGGLMVTEYAAIPESATAEHVVEELRANVDRYSHYVAQYVYVVDPRGRLRGVLRLRDLLLAASATPVTEVMIRDPISARSDLPLAELYEIFERHAFVGVPVVDAAGLLLGIVLRESVYEARMDQAAAEGLKARGIVGGEELRSLPVLVRSGRRLSWLSINILLNVIAASVIAMFEDTLQAVIALAIFLPIISDMSGCSGNQAVAVSLRELALGVTRTDEIMRVLLKESLVGILNGMALGTLLGVGAWLWKDNAVLGLVVGAALATNTLISVCIGGAVPLLVKRLGYDPALASGPMLTTVTDMCGFFLVLSLATLTLSHLR